MTQLFVDMTTTALAPPSTVARLDQLSARGISVTVLTDATRVGDTGIDLDAATTDVASELA